MRDGGVRLPTALAEYKLSITGKFELSVTKK